MTDHVNYVGRVDHPILMNEADQTVMIKGFAGRLTGDVMLFNSFGRKLSRLLDHRRKPAALLQWG